MAKITLDTITSAYASTSLFQSNFSAIEDELNDKVLYRVNPAGEANQMENDLDMNSNDILNVNDINTTSLTVDGTAITPNTNDQTLTYLDTEFTTQAGQDTFLAAYTVGFVDVYYNGVLMATADYTATNGTSVVLASTVVDNADVITIRAFSAFSAGDGITQTVADARYLLEANNLSDLNSASTSRTNLGLGTAATADVQTSSTDTTADALMAVGAFGTGSTTTPNWPTSDLHDVAPSGNYYTSTALNKPTSAGWVQNDTRSTDYIRLTWTSAIDGSKWVQEKLAGTWSDWVRADPQAFGFGEGTTTVVDLNTEFTVSQRYVSSSSSNKPSGEVEGGMLMVTRAGGGDVQQTYLSSPSARFYVRSGDDADITAGSVAWEPVYTGANYEPDDRAGLNTKEVYFMVSGTAAVDATVSGSLLYFAKLNSSGQYIPSTNSPSGTTFKNLSVQSCSTTVPCTFTRQA